MKVRSFLEQFIMFLKIIEKYGFTDLAPGIRSPSAMVWNAHACPEGRVVPLRQMQPPVYFYQNQINSSEPLNVQV
jgi:hypothetical protein